MTGIPKGWREDTLGDLVRLRGEKQSPGTNPEAVFVGLEDVEAHTSRILQYGRAGDLKSAAACFSSGEILYSRLRPYLNKVFLADRDGLASAEFLVLKPAPTVNADFVRRRIMMQDFLEFTASLDRGDRPRVDFKQIAEFAVQVPPLSEQIRIVAKLNSLSGCTARARQQLGRISALIQKYRQAILSAAFSGELTQEWRLTKKIKRDWETRKVDKIISAIVAGKNFRCAERPPHSSENGVVKVSAVTWGNFDPMASKTLPADFTPPERTRIKSGDFLISRANTLELVGAAVIVEQAPANLFLSDKILRLEMREEHKTWLLWFLRSPEGRAAIEETATGNQLSMRNLSQDALRNINVPWPSPQEMNAVLSRIKTAFVWLDRVAAEHANASRLLPKLDQAILAKAFRGELVPREEA